MATSTSTPADTDNLPDPSRMGPAAATDGVFHIDEGIKLEKVLGKEDFRPVLAHAWIYEESTTTGTGKSKETKTAYFLAGTDSYSMARIPLKGSPKDGTKLPVPVSVEALKALEKSTRFELSEDGETITVDDTSYRTRPMSSTPPNFTQLIADSIAKEGKITDPTFVFGVNAKLMANVAEALGANAKSGGAKGVVVATVTAATNAIVVRLSVDETDKVGLLMPVRVSR